MSEGLTQLNLLPRIEQGIHDRLMSELHKSFDLVPSVLGDNSGLLGAAAAAWKTTANHRDHREHRGSIRNYLRINWPS